MIVGVEERPRESGFNNIVFVCRACGGLCVVYAFREKDWFRAVLGDFECCLCFKLGVLCDWCQKRFEKLKQEELYNP